MNNFLLEKITRISAQIDAGSANIPNTSPEVILKNALNTVYLVAAIIAIIAIIIAGIMFNVANGDPNTISKAKNTILYSIIGLVVIIVAFSITSFVIGSLK